MVIDSDSILYYQVLCDKIHNGIDKEDISEKRSEKKPLEVL